MPFSHFTCHTDTLSCLRDGPPVISDIIYLEHRTLILDIVCRYVVSFILDFVILCTVARLVLFPIVIWPLDPISKGRLTHLNPLASISASRYEYLTFFLVRACSIFCSKLVVNSNNQTVATAVDLSIMTISGF